MLLTQASRDLHARIAPRWALLRAWLADPAHAEAAAKVRAPTDSLFQHWVAVDNGLLSDPDDVDGAYLDLETAETRAVGVGYPPPAGYHGPKPSTEAQHLGAAQPAAQAVEDSAKQNPLLDYLTDPGEKASETDRAKCKAAGLPDFWCEDRAPGLQDVPWWVWAIGATGIGVVGFAGYTVYKHQETLIPLALALGAPEALRAAPHVERAMEER